MSYDLVTTWWLDPTATGDHFRRMALNEKQQQFCREYVVDLNATQAYIRAGYAEAGAGSSAFTLLQNPEIQSFIQEVRAKIAEETEITAANVLKRMWNVATADPNELIEYRRVCCRYCWGDHHLFQYTEGEMRERRIAFDKHKPDPKPKRGPGRPRKEDAALWDADAEFELEGGVGYDPRRRPHPECPECLGEGEARPFPKDTRDLSPAARALYAGVKVTKDGFEIKTHNQTAALEKVAKWLGMDIDRTALVNADGTDKEFAPIMFVPVEAKPVPEDEK